MLSWPLPKDPDEVLDYQFDWSQRLEAGEQITSSTFLVDGTVELGDSSLAGGMTTVFVAGGVSGETAKITNRITTNQGRTQDQTGALRIRAR